MSHRTLRALAATLGIVAAPFALSVPARAQLDRSINLVSSGQLGLQSQTDPRWDRFLVGPRQFTRLDPNPATAISMARCGCLLTSLSTAFQHMSKGGTPWYTHSQFIEGFLTPKRSFSPRYLDDYFNIGPYREKPYPLGWGYSGGGGLACGVTIYPFAASGLSDGKLDDGTPVFATGVEWNTLKWSAIARQDIDSGLLQGNPSIVVRSNGTGGFHANLIVGWDHPQQKYLIYDPMWAAQGSGAIAGTDYRGDTDEQRYSNYINDIVNVLPLETMVSPSVWMMIHNQPEPIELRLTDPRGRRTGHDPATGKHIQETRTAFYSEFTSFADPLNLLPEGPPERYIAARNPEAGAYGLEVFGTGNAPFVLTLSTTTGGRPQRVATMSETITSGEIKRYEIVRAADGGTTVAAVAEFAPRARAGTDANGFLGAAVTFDGRGSYQISGEITTHSWDFGDGAGGAGAQQTHTYAATGVYTATLTVANAAGMTGTDRRTVLVVDQGSLPPMETVRVNLTSAGAQTGGGGQGRVTSNGRYVVFSSSATNLVAGDTNGRGDVFVKDLLTGALERASVATGGAEGISGLGTGSSEASISDDGRFVAFMSDATNLRPGDMEFTTEAFLRDRLLGTTELISPNRPRAHGDVSISADGNHVAFSSYDALVSADLNTTYDIYVRDRRTGTVQLASADGAGMATGAAARPAISADGNLVAFKTHRALDPEDMNDQNDVYIRDLAAGVTELVSVSETGGALTMRSDDGPAISADGRFIAFSSDLADNLSADVFVRDRLLRTTALISVSSTGEKANRHAAAAGISPDGRFVAFWSSADNLAPDSAPTYQVYRHDRQDHTTVRVSVNNSGSVSSPSSSAFMGGLVSVTLDGAVVFASSATNLVLADTNGAPDVFIRRPVPGGGSSASTTPLANLAGPYLGWASSVAVPAGIRLDGSRSLDPKGRTLTARWDFGDGSPVGVGSLVPTHAYAAPGIYRITLTVSAGSDTSAPVHSEVEVLPALPSDQLLVGACSARNGTIAFEGAASSANATLIANGWDTSHGPLQPARVTMVLPWGQVDAATTLPGLTFEGAAVVPAAFGDGTYVAAVASGGPAANFNVPCATSSNLPPLAVAGGPIYQALAGATVTLDGTASTDPEHAPLSYRWDFGDDTSGPGASPAHTYASEGNYFVTLVVNDGTQNSSRTVGTRSFAMVAVTAEAGPRDVTDQLTIARGGFTLNRATGHYVQIVTVRNTSPDAIAGPVSLVLDGVSGSATLFTRTGTTTGTGPLSPYLDLDLGGDALLMPNEAVTLVLRFLNPQGRGIAYSTRVLAGIGNR